MIIDMTPQFAVILRGMDILLVVAVAALLVDVLGHQFGSRKRAIRQERGVSAGLSNPARV